ncbi:Peptidase S54, rhomboid [Cynara cardunculus var. scolymus]|uniref:RHOMBOID-like protein n=1 Tax=Cynara cardunculus var. scolymus TaxID=59895 RepID=A0A103YMU8_CYNCS|nr:Peptidase S54, rhomboid [Cynara cardunculus var. scolymus]
MARSSSRESPMLEIEVQSPRVNAPPVGSPPVADLSSPPPEVNPYKDWVPWLVPTIVFVNVITFLVSMFINNCPDHSNRCIAPGFLKRFAFESLKINPLLGPSSATLLKMGALELKKVVEEKEVWRIATCMWLHAVRIGLLYVLSGIGGSILSSLFVRTIISVGASGALFGLLGGMLSELLINWTIYANKVAALSTLVFVVLINMAVGILPHVDNFAHLGGFFSGFLLGFTVGLVLVIRGVNGNDYCSWCHYLTCIPTPLWQCDLVQLDKQVNMTCLQNGNFQSYTLENSNDTNDQMQKLCSELCS